MCRYAVSLTKDKNAAEELVQQTFVQIWEKRDSISLSESLLAYFFRAIRNRFLNDERHKKIVEQHIAQACLEKQVAYMEEFEVKEKVFEAVNSLPIQCGRVFTLNRFEGKKYQEVAEELNISVKTVENQMGKALRLLRVALKDFITIIVLLINYFHH